MQKRLLKATITFLLKSYLRLPTTVIVIFLIFRLLDLIQHLLPFAFVVKFEVTIVFYQRISDV